MTNLVSYPATTFQQENVLSKLQRKYGYCCSLNSCTTSFVRTMSRIGMVQQNSLLRLIILMGKCKHFSTEAVEKAHWFILETL